MYDQECAFTEAPHVGWNCETNLVYTETLNTQRNFLPFLAEALSQTIEEDFRNERLTSTAESTIGTKHWLQCVMEQFWERAAGLMADAGAGTPTWVVLSTEIATSEK